jgi:plastocyanin
MPASLLFLLLLLPSVSIAATVTVNVGANGLTFSNAVGGGSTTTINVGDTVHWVWGTSGHTVTSGPCTVNNCTADGNFSSGQNTLNQGATFDHVFNSADTFKYFCIPHGTSGMQGTIVVQQAVQTGPTVAFAEQPLINLLPSSGNSWITSADLNGDGIPDLAVSNVGSNNLFILTGIGTGAFNSTTSKTTGTGPKMVIAVEVNGDLSPDLVTANGADLSLFTNNSGTLANAQSLGGQGFHPSAVAGFDFNGDFKQDLVVSDGTSTTQMQLLTGNGLGGFSNGTITVTGNTGFVATGQMGLDPAQDVVVLFATAATLQTLTGNGAGTFSPQGGAAPAGSTPASFVLGDFAKTGRPGAVVAAPGNNALKYLANNGDGSFAGFVTLDSGATSGPVAVAAGDLNLDGNLDVVSANKGLNNISVFMGNGTTNSTFNGAQNFTVPPGMTAPTSVVVADFNGDGAPDIAVSGTGPQSSNAVGIFLNKGGVSVALNSDNPNATSGHNVKFTATVTPSVQGTTGTPSGTVEFDDLGQGPVPGGSSVALVGGVASVTTSTLQAGAHQITAHYNGSSTFYPRTSAGISQSVKIPTTLVLTSDPNPSTVDQTVTFTATLSHNDRGPLAPGGSVNFKIGASVLGQGVQIGDNPTTFITPTLPVNLDGIPIHAEYGGDAEYQPSTSIDISQVVRPAIFPDNIDFGDLVIHSHSAPLIITVTNFGAQSINTGAETLTGNFSQTNDCGLTLAASNGVTPTLCHFFITFSPAVLGPDNSQLVHGDVTDVNVNGTGVDFLITVTRPVRGTRSSAAAPGGVVAGAAIPVHVNISAPLGTRGLVNLACTDLPPGTTCELSPAQMELAQGGGDISVTLRTTLRGARRLGGTRGTPAGTYVVRVRASSGALVHSVPIEFTVR